MESLSSFVIILNFFCFLFPFNASLAYLLKNCTVLYQENPSVEVFLDCANRNLVTVPDDLPRDVVSLQLYSNLVEKINKEDFCGTSKLRYLDLSNNLIAYVDNGSFIDLIFLKTLKMKNNNLTSLTSNMFQGLSSLTMLDLSENKIQFIHDSALQFLTSLQFLDLSTNLLQRVTDIEPILLLPQMQRLDLMCNLFPSFETKDLAVNLSLSLKELSVSGNNFRKFSITTPIFPYLRKLDLTASGYPLISLKWDIPDKTLLRNITHLYLRDPVFSYEGIQKVLQSLNSLKHLRMNYVAKWIKRGVLSTVCKIPTLRRLDLFENILYNFTFVLLPCSQLTELDLEETSILELPKGSLETMKNLRSLNVSTNLLTKVPYDIRSLTFLEVLNMNNNLISELTCEDFVNTTRLTELSLNTNRILKLERCVFESFTNLKFLDLNNNLLLTFGDAFKVDLRKLESLDLSHNSMTTLGMGDFQGLQSLKQLNVASVSLAKLNHKTFQGLKKLKALTVLLPIEFNLNFGELKHWGRCLSVYCIFLDKQNKK